MLGNPTVTQNYMQERLKTFQPRILTIEHISTFKAEDKYECK